MLSNIWNVLPPQGFFSLSLSDQSSLLIEIPSFMVILNATPDSFADSHISLKSKIRSAINAAKAGTRFIDVGGESSRPGASSVSQKIEIDRVLPVVQSLSKWIKTNKSNSLISIDTTKVAVADAAFHAGAHIINDVSSGDASNQQMIAFAASHKIPIIFNHAWGSPKNFYNNFSKSSNIVADIRSYLKKKVDLYTSQGGSIHSVFLDPGIGFGKDLTQNLSIINNIQEIGFSQRPILIGISNKRVVNDLLDRPRIQDRISGSLGLQLASICKGASIIRTHNPILMIDLCKAFISGLRSC